MLIQFLISHLLFYPFQGKSTLWEITSSCFNTCLKDFKSQAYLGQYLVTQVAYSRNISNWSSRNCGSHKYTQIIWDTPQKPIFIFRKQRVSLLFSVASIKSSSNRRFIRQVDWMESIGFPLVMIPGNILDVNLVGHHQLVQLSICLGFQSV